MKQISSDPPNDYDSRSPASSDAPSPAPALPGRWARVRRPEVLSRDDLAALEQFVRTNAAEEDSSATELRSYLENCAPKRRLSPYATLRFFMDRDKDHRTETEIYKAAGFSRQKFSRIRSESSYRLAKIDLLSLAVVLRLGLDGTLDLLGRFGFTLSNYDKSDLIVRFFLERNDSSVVRINDALYTYGLPLLCNVVE